MSSSSVGRQREHSCRRQLEKLSYAVFRAAASKGLCDLFAISLDPNVSPRCIAISVGGVGKSVTKELKTLRSKNVPIDTTFLVALCRGRTWRYYNGNTQRGGEKNLAVAISLAKEN